MSRNVNMTFNIYILSCMKWERKTIFLCSNCEKCSSYRPWQCHKSCKQQCFHASYWKTIYVVVSSFQVVVPQEETVSSRMSKTSFLRFNNFFRTFFWAFVIVQTIIVNEHLLSYYDIENDVECSFSTSFNMVHYF